MFGTPGREGMTLIGALLLLLLVAAGVACWWYWMEGRKPAPGSVEAVRAAADGGDAAAAVRMGQMCADGLEVEQNYLQSAMWFRKAAEQGSAEGKYQLGRLYEEGAVTENGIGVGQDWKKAAGWYKSAAEQGYADAEWKIGLCLRDGKGVEKDVIWAKLWLEKAALQGHEEAQAALEKLKAGIQEKDDPLVTEQMAAEDGDVVAQCHMGQRCFRGEGVPKDEVAGATWYRKAAEQGYAEGECRWGDCLRMGRGVEKDEAAGVEWYRKAADQGHVGAKYRLGECFRLGQGTRQDVQAAQQWYYEAAEEGHAGAQRTIGKYLMAAGDKKGSLGWLQKSAEGGDAEGQYYLALCHQKGLGTAKNPAAAKQWLRASAKNGYVAAQSALNALERNTGGLPVRARQGDRNAQYELGKELVHSRDEKEQAQGLAWLGKAANAGVVEAAVWLGNYYERKNPQESFHWWSRAADMGSPEAQWQMVRLCQKGEGTPQSDSEALRWARKVAERGDEEAMSFVADCYANGRGCRRDYEQAKRWYIRAGERRNAERMERLAAEHKQSFNNLKRK